MCMSISAVPSPTLGTCGTDKVFHTKETTMMWIWVLLAIVFIALLVPLFNRSRGAQTKPPTSSGNQKSAIEILEDRYARGEIERDEYEQMRQQLRR